MYKTGNCSHSNTVHEKNMANKLDKALHCHNSTKA